MRNFICGVMFAGGVALFGKSMYELGRSRERKEIKTKLDLIKETIKCKTNEEES